MAQAAEAIAADDIDRRIDAWVEATRAMTGKIVEERKPWIEQVTPESIRHFIQGTDDNNPLWSDRAPPAFVFTNRYPMLHGAPMHAPLASLIGGVEVVWENRPIRVGDRLSSEPRQKEFYEKRNKDGRRLNFVISEVAYRNGGGDLLATAKGTMIMATQIGLQTMMDHTIRKLTRDDLAKLEATWRSEFRRGTEPLHVNDVKVGDSIPSIVRGPLTIGDMVTWQAGVGTSYKGGSWGYLELQNKMHTAMYNPATGFPVKYSMQHEDFNMAAGRGMPAPFDNGVMRFAWVAPLITNWIGSHGFLRRLNVLVKRPGLYGDVTTYSGKVTAVDAAAGAVTIAISGVRQDGLETTGGEAEVILPKR